jgi:hypothetical protein
LKRRELESDCRQLVLRGRHFPVSLYKIVCSQEQNYWKEEVKHTIREHF